jgi:hypothetical protein
LEQIVSVSLNPQPMVVEPFGQTGVRQYLFPLLTCMSLACMILSLGMWVRSHYLVDQLFTERSELTWYVSSIYGRVLIVWGEESPVQAMPQEWTYRQYPMQSMITDGWKDSAWKRLGIEARFEPHSAAWGGERTGWIRIRWPFIAAVWGVLPVMRVLREGHRKRHLHRMRSGRCPSCGCDIRLTPSRCPECGTPALLVQA